MNETHDPELWCWLVSAHEPLTDFPIQNLPFGIFRYRGTPARAGVAIGNRILDVYGCLKEKLFPPDAVEAAESCSEPALNALIALGRAHGSALRMAISRLLRRENPALRDHPRREALVPPMAEAELLMPCAIGDYTDFYASIDHARNVGSMFRPDNPLLPNYKYVPIAYHGRSSSIVVSGTPVHRPYGQIAADPEGPPVFAPSAGLDYELEAGFVIGTGNRWGERVRVDEAEDHIFGMCLVNDWSARDIQRWEYQPLGPFLSKSFGTTISPWIVMLEALEPYRVPWFQRLEGDPEPLPYLYSRYQAGRGGIDLTMEAWLQSARMKEQSMGPIRVSSGNLRDLYWTPAQMIAHHTSNGCNLRTGDLIASGTVSGASDESMGCLLERTRRGQKPFELPGGETRKFLADGDEVVFRACCERPGFARIGFGACAGTIRPAAQPAEKG